jgi:hypothetical protein
MILCACRRIRCVLSASDSTPAGSSAVPCVDMCVKLPRKPKRLDPGKCAHGINRRRCLCAGLIKVITLSSCQQRARAATSLLAPIAPPSPRLNTLQSCPGSILISCQMWRAIVASEHRCQLQQLAQAAHACCTVPQDTQCLLKSYHRSSCRPPDQHAQPEPVWLCPALLYPALLSSSR